MIIIQSIIFLLLFSGLFILLNINLLPSKKTGSISFKKTTAREKRVKINAEATLTRFEKIILHMDSLLQKIGKTRAYLYVTMAICFLIGSIVGYICFMGTFLSLATGISFVPLSYLYLIFRTQETTREDLAELQNTMSIITNAYLSNNNILRAVEMYVAERRRYEDGSIKKVTPFEEFVSDCLYVSSNIDRNLSLLAAKINNKYFDQWVKNLRLCMKDKQMRFSLQPVIDAMADEKIMQIESDSQMQKTWATYLMVVATMFAVIPALRVSKKEWYLVLTQTFIGQILILLMLIGALVSAIYVMKINKPIGTI